MFPSTLPPSYAWASAPSASSVPSGTVIRITDVGPNGINVISNGSKWKPLNGVALLYRQTDDIVHADNTNEQAGAICTIPLGLFGVNDVFRLTVTFFRSAADSDTIQTRWRFGTDSAGLAGTQIRTNNMASTTRMLCSVFDFQVLSNTSIIQLGADTFESYLGSTNSTPPAAITVSDMSVSAMYISNTTQKTVDTLTTFATVRGTRVEWIG